MKFPSFRKKKKDSVIDKHLRNIKIKRKINKIAISQAQIRKMKLDRESARLSSEEKKAKEKLEDQMTMGIETPKERVNRFSPPKKSFLQKLLGK